MRRVVPTWAISTALIFNFTRWVSIYGTQARCFL